MITSCCLELPPLIGFGFCSVTTLFEILKRMFQNLEYFSLKTFESLKLLSDSDNPKGYCVSSFNDNFSK